jgi:Flp pilus assembly protein TadG
MRDHAGNVAIVTALSLPVVLGVFGVGAEAGSWISAKRALQNAADAAAIAAATNASSTYDAEAKAVTARYGFQNGSGGVTVTSSNAVPCPAGVVTGPCYSVTVNQTTPLLLAQVVGYKGDTTLNGAPAKIISATAIAVQGDTVRPYCLLALGTSGVTPAIRTNGSPFADLSGCNIMSNTDANCNGHNLKADDGDAHKTNDGCGVVQHSNVSTVPDPYADRASNIPTNDGCSGNYQATPTKKGSFNPLMISGSVTKWCGYAGLNSDITVTQDTTLYIYNGDLDLNGYTLRTSPDAHLTIVFSGSNLYSHTITGGGTLDFQAPAKDSGSPWQGIALYQDPALTSGVDIASAGNSPTWDITGIAYFPHASVTFSGAVNKSSNGKSCFAMVVDNVTINGTGSILAHGECGQAGVDLPTGQVAGRGKLVS